MNTTWGLNRVELATSQTGPGNTATFNFQVRAPSAPGTYTFQWQMLQEGSEWFGVATYPITVTVREPLNNAELTGQNIATGARTGQRQEVTVTMRNNGETAWTRAQQYTLMAQNPHNNTTWGLNRVPLPVDTVNPGESATFRFDVTAPATAGQYASQWGMQREGYGSFGASTNNVTVNVTEPVNNAQPVSQTVLTQVEAGKSYTVSVTMVNNGETTWTRAQNYILMSRYPWNDMSWGLNRVALPFDPVAPGQTATFTFQITAPTTPGSYPFQWGMLREGVVVFGPGTNLEMVNVVAPPPLVNNAQVVGMTVPNRMITGNTYNVAVIMQNTGTTTWSPGANYRLGSQNPHDNFIWGMHRVALGSTVAPGQSYTFTFPVTAPTAGAYTMQWGMVQDGVEWFGASAGSPVTVTENLGNVTFIHTDGLGSPVARTDATGNVVSRTRYEPYGFTASGAAPTIGFTGHVNDADTGLTYMQQRYYDPVAGRFLSIDPVMTDASTGGSFNRYAYANNNPYKYTDPDGRFSTADCAAMAGNCTTYGGSGGNSSSGTAKAAGTVFGGIAGGAMGVAASAACDFYSAGGCVVANGTIVGAGITGGAVIGAVAGQRLDNAWTQLSGLMAKATAAGPLEYQYALIAQRDGVYPDVRNGLAQLKAGDVWKYGTTNDPNSRYPQNSIGTLNLRMEIQSTGTRYQTLVAEKLKLYNILFRTANFLLAIEYSSRRLYAY